MAPNFFDDLIRRPEFHDILVEGTEQVEGQVLRLRRFRGVDQQTQARGPRQDLVEGLSIERIVDDDVPEQLETRWSEAGGQALTRPGDSPASPAPRSGPPRRGGSRSETSPPFGVPSDSGIPATPPSRSAAC